MQAGGFMGFKWFKSKELIQDDGVRVEKNTGEIIVVTITVTISVLLVLLGVLAFVFV